MCSCISVLTKIVTFNLRKSCQDPQNLEQYLNNQNKIKWQPGTLAGGDILTPGPGGLLLPLLLHLLLPLRQPQGGQGLHRKLNKPRQKTTQLLS